MPPPVPSHPATRWLRQKAHNNVLMSRPAVPFVCTLAFTLTAIPSAGGYVAYMLGDNGAILAIGVPSAGQMKLYVTQAGGTSRPLQDGTSHSTPPPHSRSRSGSPPSWSRMAVTATRSCTERQLPQRPTTQSGTSTSETIRAVAWLESSLHSISCQGLALEARAIRSSRASVVPGAWLSRRMVQHHRG